MEKIWLKQYEPGVPAEIDIDEFHSAADVFARSVEQFRDRPAFANRIRFASNTMSYGEIDTASRDLAAYLQSELKLAKGERVAIMMPNLLQYPIAVFGILRAGLTVVNVNPLYTPRELEHQLKDSGATAIIIVANFAHVLAAVIERTAVKHVILTQIGDLLGFKGTILSTVMKLKKMVPPFSLPQAVPFKTALSLGKRHASKPVAIDHDDIAFLQYTGGTTGVAKGAMLTHGNIIANMQQAHAWIQQTVDAGGEVIVCALPLYHIFCLTANCMVFTKIGALNVLITNPRDIPAFVEDLSRFPITCITGVNTLFNALMNNPEFARLDFSTWKLALGGGMAVQKAVAEHWRQVTGIPLIEAYGLTETSPAACINPMHVHAYNGTIGLPVSSTNIDIRDAEGKSLAVGEAGELYIKGPQVMKGYWQRPEDTAKSIDANGWLATGDMAVLQADGYVKLVDRKKDMVLVSGFNVYPNEVEDVVAMHPGVSEVACIGVPDEKSGEVVKIFVVKRDPALTEQDLRDHCKKNLTGYKLPRLIEFRSELPKTNVGKILRRSLRDEELAKLGGKTD